MGESTITSARTEVLSKAQGGLNPKTWRFTRMFQAGWISSCKTRIAVA